MPEPSEEPNDTKSGAPEFRRRRLLGRAALAAIAVVLGPGATATMGQETPLAGKTIELHSGYSEGSPANLLFQALADAMQRQLPGTRIVFRGNSGGTAALTAAMIASAEPDGTTIGTLDTDSLMAKAIGEEQYDLSDFAIIGSLERDDSMLFATTASGIGSLDDLRAYDGAPVLPVRSTSSGAYFRGFLLNALLSTRVRPVTGYNSGARELAFKSGEGQLQITGIERGVRYLEEGDGVAIVRLTDTPVPPPFDALPLLSDLEVTPEYAWVPRFFNAVSIGHVLGAPRGTPAPVLAALRTAFDAAVRDPVFVEAATDLTVLRPLDGPSVEALIGELLGQLGSFADSLASGLACGEQLAETGAPC